MTDEQMNEQCLALDKAHGQKALERAQQNMVFECFIPYTGMPPRPVGNPHWGRGNPDNFFRPPSRRSNQGLPTEWPVGEEIRKYKAYKKNWKPGGNDESKV